jgi:hypothetical protein
MRTGYGFVYCTVQFHEVAQLPDHGLQSALYRDDTEDSELLEAQEQSNNIVPCYELEMPLLTQLS